MTQIMNKKYVTIKVSKILKIINNRKNFYMKEVENFKPTSERVDKLDLKKPENMQIYLHTIAWESLTFDFELVYTLLEVLFDNLAINEVTLEKDLKNIKKVIEPYDNKELLWVLQDLHQHFSEKEKDIKGKR